jgi:DNA-binding CsgD family transcriptional regulator
VLRVPARVTGPVIASCREAVAVENNQPRGLLGRTRELVETDLALARSASGEPQVLLVGGDAGIGKTSLAASVAVQARDRGFAVVTGHCLDVDTAVPLRPVLEALQEFVAARPDESLPPVTRRLAPFLRGQSGPDEATSQDAVGDLRFSLMELVREAPVMLVLEDLHWADSSTQDAAMVLARTMRGPFLMMLTYRAEEVTRRHPLRRALAEIARTPGAHRVDLGPLDRAGIAGIVERATGEEDPPLVTSILARSGGNPLFAEELLAASGDGVPQHLNALLLARVDALTPDTRALVDLAAVAGSRVDQVLLGQAAALSDGVIDAQLREALDANVLSHAGAQLQFRHALMREAIYLDLLPEERTRAHVAFAQVLQARVDAADSPRIADLSALAYHWFESGETSRAFVAHLRAGQAILRYGAPESLAHLERVLDLWAAVPAPEALGDVAKPEVMRLLAQSAARHGDVERADRYLLAALDALDDATDPRVASRVYASYGQYNKQFEGRLEQTKALEMAVSIVDGTPSKELAMALATLSSRSLSSPSMGSAVTLASRAVEVAIAADCPVEHAYALWALADSSWEFGRCREALSYYGEAARVADEAGANGLALHIEADGAYGTLSVGEIARAVAIVEAGRARALSLGLPDAAALHGEQLVGAFCDAGNFAEAERLLEQSKSNGMHEHRWRTLRATLLLARGDLETAVPLVRDGIARLEAGARSHEWEIALYVDVLSALGRIREVMPLVEGELADRFQHESPLTLARAACTAYTALVSAKGWGGDGLEDLRDGAEHALARALEGMTDEWSSTIEATEALRGQALARSLDGASAVPEWRVAAAAAATHGDYRALRPRLGLACALLECGERTEAREELLGVWQLAVRIGAGGVEAESARVARRNRIALPGLEELPRQLGALTPREREVLGLLALGAGNRDIAERLFISEKTASVHVSHILSKLGVANRGSAAALARELMG